MPTKHIRIQLEVPPGTSEATKQAVQSETEEAAVLALWKTGDLSTRRAAEELGLTYRDFLDLLTAKGIPVEQGPLDLEALAAVRERLAQERE